VGNTKSGAAVFDDYAHHPTEIKKTLSSLRERYPEANIICVFQPHTFSRTKKMFDEFITSFTDASRVILTDIYASQREPFDASITSKQLADRLVESGNTTVYLPMLTDVVQYITHEELGSDAIIVTMGAGDVYQVAYDVIMP